MNTQVETEPESRTVATHLLLDAAGAVVEDFEKGAGIRYVDKASGATFDYFPDGKAKDMLALFGARTLATNEASQIRNGKEFKGRPASDSSQEQVGAIKDRFALIDSGVWVDRTREAGVRWDPALVITAFIEVAKNTAKGKAKSDDEWNAFHAQMLAQSAEPESKVIATLRSVEGVEAMYRKLQGKTSKSVDDVLATLGA